MELILFILGIILIIYILNKWSEPKYETTTIISDSSKAKDFEPPQSTFGANTDEKDETSEKMEKLIKEIKDL